MSDPAGSTFDAVADSIVREFGTLGGMTPCGAEAVSNIVHRTILDSRPVDGYEGHDCLLVHEAMLGVVRGTLATRADARETARGAILGVLRVTPALGGTVRAAFADAARVLILKTSALGGQYDATVRGVLLAGLREGGRLGLSRREVMTVVEVAILDSAMAFIQRVPLGVLWSGRCCPEHQAPKAVAGGPDTD